MKSKANLPRRRRRPRTQVTDEAKRLALYRIAIKLPARRQGVNGGYRFIRHHFCLAAALPPNHPPRSRLFVGRSA